MAWTYSSMCTASELDLIMLVKLCDSALEADASDTPLQKMHGADSNGHHGL